MRSDRYLEAREAMLAGADPPGELIAECRRVAGLMIRTAGLPAHYSPLGVWSEEATEEAFADFMAERLIGRGQLLAMLQRAPVLPVFRRMLETALRQHLIDRLERSQSANLYSRIAGLLQEHGSYAATGSGSGRLWQLATGPADPFTGDDRALGSLAFSLGEFTVMRYQPDARKLSPLLDSDELTRFLDGLLAGGAMTLATIMRALKLRFSLDDPSAAGELNPEAHAASGLGADPQQILLRREAATAALAELSDRQAEVLIGIERKETTRELALRLHCSTGTISYERAQLAQVLARTGAEDPGVLKEILDALFIGEE
jgi:hypothetical protein